MAAFIPLVLVSLLGNEEEAHRGIAPQTHVMVTPTVPGAPPIIIPGNHPPVWTPNNEEACKKEGPPGGWGTGGPSQGEKNSHLFPQECLDMNPNPPDYCRGWGSGGCQPNDCHMTVVEDSGDLAPHGQRWACEVSDCNADDMTNLATQTLDWHFDLARVEHPHYDTCHQGRETPTCPNEQDTHDYTDPCDRLYFDTANPPADCSCPMMGRTDTIETSTWDSSEFWDDNPDAFFREGDKCDPPLDGPPVCTFGGNPGLGGTGTIQFTTAPDRWGTFYYNVWMSDDGITFPVCNGMCGVPIPCAGGCGGAVDVNGIPAACNVNPPGQTCKVCKLTILPVNDCPVWDSIGDITVLEDRTDANCAAGTGPAPPKGDSGVARPYGVCINNWATNIGAGGWFEWPYQNVWFDCVTDNTLLFKPGYLPRIDGVGKLTNDNCVRNCRGDHCSSRDLMFTLADDQCGFATVSCTLYDDGGENDDGCDKSPVVTFTIDVKCVNDAPSFTPSRTEIQVDEDACEHSNTNDEHCTNGVYCSSNWATDILAGPPNEQSGGGCGPSGGTCMFQPQTVHFVVSSADPAFDTLFSSTPTVDEQGRLCLPLAQHHHTGNGFIDLSVMIFDSGGTADGGVDRSAPVNLRLRVTPVNDVPTFTMGNSVMVLEDSGAANIQQVTDICLGGLFGPTCADFNERPEPQAERFEIRNVYDESLFAVQPTISATGQLQFTPAADKSGTVELEVSLCDSAVAPVTEECSPVQGVIITIVPVNDPPLITHSGDITVSEDSPLYTNPNWASVLSVGSPEDEQQSQELVVVSVVAADPSLFEIQPTLQMDGTLSFKAAPNKVGTTAVTVHLVDNGGTLNGGQDTTTETFQITVGGVNDPPIVSTGVDSVVVNEDSGMTTVSNFAVLLPGPTSEVNAGQTIAATACTNTNTNLFVATAQPELSLTGDLSFTPTADAFGEATVTCTITDSLGAFSSLQFKVIVQPVNDPPTFDVVPSTATMRIQVQRCTASEGSRCSRTIANAVSNVEPGPPNESIQTVRFEGQFSSANLHPIVSGFLESPNGGDLHLTLNNDGGSGDVDVDMTQLATDNGNPAASTSKVIYLTVIDPPVPPSMLQPADVSSYEDTAINEVGFGQQISANTASAACTALNATLIPSLSMDIATGILTGSPGQDLYGTTTATCTLTSSSGLQTGYQFQITITPVNDAPYFNVTQSVVMVSDSLPQSIPFIGYQNPSGKDGPDNENDQSLTYYFSGQNNNNGNLFASGPTLEGNLLKFTGIENAVGTAIIRISVRDDGGTLHGGQDIGNTQEVAIIFGETNKPPSFSVNGATEYTILEDADTTTVRRWAIQISDGDTTDGTVTQQLAFVIQPLPSTLLKDIYVDHVSGDLVFTPLPDAFGSEIFTVILKEVNTQLTSSPVTITIHVTAVNDAPIFNAASTSIIADSQIQVGDSHQYVYPWWARDLSAGPVNENGQTLQFDVTVPPTNGLLQSVDVHIPDGNVSFVINSEGRTGVVPVQVCLKDNGGTANNGDDTTCSSVDITVVNSVQTGFLKSHDITVMQTAGVVLVKRFITDSMITVTGMEIKNVFLNQNTNFDQDPTVASTITDSMLFTKEPLIENSDLSFTTNRTTDGKCTITVTATNAMGEQLSEECVITINMVPNLPSFNPGVSPLLITDAVAMSEGRLPWAVNISHGLPPPYTSNVNFIVSPGPSLFNVGAEGQLELNTQPYNNIMSMGSLNNIDYTLSYDVRMIRVKDDISSPNWPLKLINTNAGGATGTFDVSMADITMVEDTTFDGSRFLFNVVAGVPTCEEVSSSAEKLISVQVTENTADSTAYDINIVPKVDVFGETTIQCSINEFKSDLKRVIITPVNDPPSKLGGGEKVTVTEDAGQVTIPNWLQVSPGMYENDDVSPVSVSLINSEGGNSITDSVTLSRSSSASDVVVFDLSLSTIPDKNGQNQVRYILTDNGSPPLTMDGTFIVEVTSVNDPPTFSIPDNNRIIKAVTNTNTQHQLVLLESITTGGGSDERSQTVTFEAFDDNGSPIGNIITDFKISPEGMLTFTAPSTPGSYVVSVLARDSGGIQNGGVDQSSLQQFTIEVASSRVGPTFTLSSTTVNIFTREFTVKDIISDIKADNVADARLSVTPQSGFANAFLSGPEITTSDGALYSVRGTVVDSWPSQTPIDVIVSISDSGGTGQSSVLTLVPYFNNQPFEVLLPPGVPLSSFLAAYESDVGSSANIMVISEENMSDGWKKVTFDITGEDRSKQEQELQTAMNDPKSAIRSIGVTSVRPVPDVPSSPSPVTNVPTELGSAVTGDGGGDLPAWVIPVAIVAALLLLGAISAAAYYHFKSPKKEYTHPENEPESPATPNMTHNAPQTSNPIANEFSQARELPSN
eukprot:TRINITY_DN2033_c5_g1_i1.p1 TRINITY_DN2033_c5_g1~~TRINITY_DN2033_c5_g1_i1.p1  ORF type:complete len:2381 (+),score=512.90 TRINITY_DN2033_c5_g1_i1:46-7188(+)